MKKIIMTVDTEGHEGKDPTSCLIMGETSDGNKYGIDLIMDICDSQQIKALFFVDIAEAWDYGEDKIAAVLIHIKERGHDIGVHIHPDHMADPKRQFLWEYSKEEQYDIIKRCTELYIKVLGVKPKVFRAGKYGANKDTLLILEELGYVADFSEFYGQKWCQIKPPVAYSKAVRLGNGLIEFPVTSYMSFSCGKYKRNDKLDADMAMGEFKYVISKLIKSQNVDPIVMFAHSFSLINWRTCPDLPKPSRKNIRKFSQMLSILKNYNEIEFVSLDELTAEIKPSTDNVLYNSVSLSGLPAMLFFVQRAFRVLKMRIEIFICRLRT